MVLFKKQISIFAPYNYTGPRNLTPSSAIDGGIFPSKKLGKLKHSWKFQLYFFQVRQL